MEFELKVQAPQTQPVVFNYDELKAGLTTALAAYKVRVYDETMIAEAKEDKAKLNKLKKALSDERISRKKDYMKPLETFEDQIKDLCSLIDEATSGIENQLNVYEQKRIEEKRIAIRELFSEIASEYDIDFITLEKIYNPKWENKSVTDKAIATEITEVFEKAVKDLEIINKMPSCSFEAKECYKTTLDLNKAIAEGERMNDIAEAKKQAEIEAQKRAEEEAKRRAEAEALMSKATEVTPKVAEPTPEPIYDFKFACRITESQALALKQFCDQNGIFLLQV